MADKISIDTDLLGNLSNQIRQLQHSLESVNGKMRSSISEVQRVAKDQDKLIQKLQNIHRKALETSERTVKLARAVNDAANRWLETEKAIQAQKLSAENEQEKGNEVLLGDVMEVEPKFMAAKADIKNDTSYVMSEEEAEHLLDFLYGKDVVGWWWFFGSHYSPKEDKVKDYFNLLTGKDTGKSPEELDELKREFLITAEMLLSSKCKINQDMLNARNERLINYVFNQVNAAGIVKQEIGDLFPASAKDINASDVYDRISQLESDFSGAQFMKNSMDAKKIEAILNSISTMSNLVQADNSGLVYEKWNALRNADARQGTPNNSSNLNWGENAISEASHHFKSVDADKYAAQIYAIEKSLAMNK